MKPALLFVIATGLFGADIPVSTPTPTPPTNTNSDKMSKDDKLALRDVQINLLLIDNRMADLRAELKQLSEQRPVINDKMMALIGAGEKKYSCKFDLVTLICNPPASLPAVASVK